MTNIPRFHRSRSLRLLFLAAAVTGAASLQAQTLAGTDDFNDNHLTIGAGQRWRFDQELAGTGTAFAERNQRMEFTSSSTSGYHIRALGWISPSTSEGAFGRDWKASVKASNLTSPSGGYTSAGLEAYALADLGAGNISNSGYWGLYLSTSANGGKWLVAEWGRWDAALNSGQGGWVRTRNERAITDLSGVVLQLAWKASNRTLAASYSFDDGATFVPARTFSPGGAEGGIDAPFASGFGLQLTGVARDAGVVAAGAILFDDMSVAVDTAFTAGTPNYAPPALTAGALIKTAGTVVDSLDGTYTETEVLTVLSATTIEGGTYTYTRTGPTKADIKYTTSFSDTSGTETETGTIAVTFTSAAAGTYTSSGSYSGKTSGGQNYTGTFTGSGTFTYEAPTAAPVITAQPLGRTLTSGENALLSVGATGATAYQWRKGDADIVGATNTSLVLTNVQAAQAGNYAVLVSNSHGSVLSDTVSVVVNAAANGPAITTQPTSQAATAGANVVLTAASATAGSAFQWQRNGGNLSGGATASLALNNLQPADAGLYTAVVTSGSASSTTTPAIVGVTTSEKVIGTGEEVGSDIQHPNGNIFDQVLMKGPAEAITSDAAKNQITRTSFLDLDDDIVQVEFSGPGTLSLVLEGASDPALPVNYNQNVNYVKGHAGIVITGATEQTNISVFTVGRATAVNQALFKDGTQYDGVADIAFIAISSANGKFGGVRTSNATYFATKGRTGVYAPGVTFVGPVFAGDITAFDDATPVLQIGAGSDVRITGGSLLQANDRAVQVSGVTQLKFTAGGDSHGNGLDAQDNQARLEQDGADVTSQIVVKPQ